MIETVDLEIKQTITVKRPTNQCPNCNGVDLKLELGYVADNNEKEMDNKTKYVHFVRCLNCNLSGPHYSTKEGGISVWNDLPREEGRRYVPEIIDIENEKK